MKTRIILKSFETSSFFASAKRIDGGKVMMGGRNVLLDPALQPAIPTEGIQVPGHPGHYFVPEMRSEWPGPVSSALNDL